jgi:hypothetical protein
MIACGRRQRGIRCLAKSTSSSLAYVPDHPFTMTLQITNHVPIVPYQHHPRRDRILLGKGIRLRPRVRRRRRAVRPATGMDRQGQPHILPPAGSGFVDERERHSKLEWAGHREYPGLCKGAGDDCVNVELEASGAVKKDVFCCLSDSPFPIG